MLKSNLPSLDDIEGQTIPAGFARVIDAHVHVFPDGMFKAVRRWFDQNAWHNKPKPDTDIQKTLPHVCRRRAMATGQKDRQ